MYALAITDIQIMAAPTVEECTEKIEELNLESEAEILLFELQPNL